VSAEAAALTAIGAFLGSVYRGELAERIDRGVLDRDGQAGWRAERKQAVTGVASSRWAGAITRAVEDQYQFGMRGLAAHVADLRAAAGVLQARCALRPGQLTPTEADDTGGQRRSRRRRGYRSVAERFAKTRRLAVLRSRLNTAERALAAGRPAMVVGGKRLWRTRNHLDAAQMTEQQGRDRWDAQRMFVSADGETGKAGGNETIRVDEAGQLRIKTPAALAAQFGTHLTIAAPVRFHHRGGEWAARVAARQAVRYDISYDPERDRWYLDASWANTPEPSTSLEELRAGPVLGVDLNADHLACCLLDASGNPVGDPTTIEVHTEGLAASRRDGRVRAAITAVLDHAQHAGCGAVVVEKLDFGDARATGRETLGRRPRGKRLRRTIAGIPTRRFRARLAGMAARRGVAVIGVDPAYTSRWGNQHWTTPFAATDFRPGHRDSPSRRGGRDRQTWPRTGDQATAGRTPHRTADRCGHTTVQARPSPRLRWQARQFRPTDTPTIRYLGSPENTRRQRPTPFGPHRTHSCALTRNGRECCRGKLVSAPSNLPFGSWQQRQDDREGEEPARR
jgi:IS605 OrfB family transposase